MSNLTYTVEYTDEYYKVYKGDSSFSSNLIYYINREALEFLKTIKSDKIIKYSINFYFNRSYSKIINKDNLSNSIIYSLIDSLIERQ